LFCAAGTCHCATNLPLDSPGGQLPVFEAKVPGQAEPLCRVLARPLQVSRSLKEKTKLNIIHLRKVKNLKFGREKTVLMIWAASRELRSDISLLIKGD
jgi:hypothetical protein